MSTIPPVPPLPPTSPSADDPAERVSATPAPGLDAADTVVAPGADDVADPEHVSRELQRSAPDKVALPELSDALLDAVASGTHHEPHGVLGSHPVAADGVSDALTVIRTRRPLASRVAAVLDSGARVELTHVRSGIWQGAHVAGLQPYRIEASYEGGPDWTADDPYAFAPTLGELDLHLIGEGRHERLWDVLGAHHRTLGTAERAVHGTSFSVWAPHASAVRVVGTFNGWHGEGHALRSMGGTGVWEIFVPDVEPGAMYKFQLRGRDGEWVTKADPLARHAETEGLTASIVAASSYEWNDTEWMERRAATNPHDGAMSVYELHAGSWRLGLGYRELADHLIEYVTELGFTHVEFMPLAEHPFGGSWGYQVTGYYAPTSRFGSPDDLRYLIDRLHQAGIGVLVDWVPGHFATDAWALAKFDGEALYEHPDPRRGEHKDWGTLIFDFGNPQVRNFLVANALYWLEEFHVDGLRVDAVASMLYLDYSREEGQWLPNIHGGNENLEAISLLQEANATAYRRNPGVVMIAEESTNWGGVTAPTSGGGLGFGFKWNMGWMHDSLQYIANDPMYRSFHHGEITFSFLYAYSENFLLPISHDEVVHGKGSLLGKMPGDHWQKLANLRAYLTFMWAHPGKQLLFMGQEFGQLSEWSEARDLDWWILDQPAHRGLHSLVMQLNRVYRENPALWALDNDAAGFEWLDGGDSTHNIVSFLRRDANGDEIAVFMNFSGATVGPYRAGFPQSGVWEEILNSDAADFGGSGVGNLGSVTARDEPWAGRPASADITLPPLAGLWLKRRR